MPKRMLIDSSHPEETRVVVLDGQKVEEFDFEAASKRPLKGNIYLAKVTRVEPSLQAAFVEYGGNRQGFLAFTEIHPDYYQIPVADRLALLADQEAEARHRQEDDIESFEITSGPKPEAAEEEDAVEASAEGGTSQEESSEEQNGDEADETEAGESDEAQAGSEEEVASFAADDEDEADEPAELEPESEPEARDAGESYPSRRKTTARPTRMNRRARNRLANIPQIRARLLLPQCKPNKAKRAAPAKRSPCRPSALRNAGCAAAITRFKRSSSAARSSWCRSSRKSAATRARR